jgi:hypothetical protein
MSNLDYTEGKKQESFQASAGDFVDSDSDGSGNFKALVAEGVLYLCCPVASFPV